MYRIAFLNASENTIWSPVVDHSSIGRFSSNRESVLLPSAWYRRGKHSPTQVNVGKIIN